ncbi:MAG: DUF1848 domain-containing protein [Candidatus Helarchaeota archaeon]|nr:DUF1848 domain-containing protein [Candidatus Helarchaeota archaeon]
MKLVISASRRTDIPAFYLDWFLEKLQQGFVMVRNPFFPAQISRVSLEKKDVHSIVLWSKDFGKFLQKTAEFTGYNLFFIFTINDNPKWEPKVISLDKRLRQLGELVADFGPQYIEYRFDPIVLWYEDGELVNNLGSFKTIIQQVSELGIDNCVINFVDWYKKSLQRAKKYGLVYYDPLLKEKIEIIKPLAEYCHQLGIKMYSCCNKNLTSVANVQPSHCIDGTKLSTLFKAPCSTAKAPTRDDCGCTTSKDIGNYREQICHHACIYCYAHPQI